MVSSLLPQTWDDLGVLSLLEGSGNPLSAWKTKQSLSALGPCGEQPLWLDEVPESLYLTSSPCLVMPTDAPVERRLNTSVTSWVRLWHLILGWAEWGRHGSAYLSAAGGGVLGLLLGSLKLPPDVPVGDDAWKPTFLFNFIKCVF